MTTKRRALGRGLAALIPAAGAQGSTLPEAPIDLAGVAVGPINGAGPATGVGPSASGAAPTLSESLARAAVPGRIASAVQIGRAPSEPREGLRVVGIEEVHPARSQPRKTFDDGRLDELAGSIRSQGLIQPLVVRVREAGGYEIIAGERRWRAAQRAGLHTIPVVVRDIAHARAFELAMVENLQREDLNPIEEAEGFDRLIQDFGYSQESLAARVGKDRTTITNALRLLKLPPGVRGLVIAGRLTMGHARAILGLESLAETRAAPAGPRGAAHDDTRGLSAEQVTARMEGLGRRVAAREMSVRQVEALVRAEREAGGGATGKTTPESSSVTSPTATSTLSGRDLATRLSRALGTRVRLVEAGPGRGHIEIKYESLDQLDGLLGKLLP